MTRPLTTLALAWVLSAVLHGQDGSVQSDEPELSIDFTVLAWQQSETRYSFESAGKVERFVLPTQYRSKEMRYVGSNPMVFFEERTAADGSAVRVPIGQVTLDPAVKKPLLLFLPAGEGDPFEHRIIALDDSLKAFPKRSYRFFNLTDEKVGLSLNEHKVVLEKYGESVIYLNTDEAMIQMGIYAKRDGKYRDVLNLRWPHQGSERYLMFIMDSPHTEGSLATKAIPEFFL